MKNFYYNFCIKYLPYFIGLLAGLYFIILPVTGFKFVYFAGDLGDGRICLYSLEHVYQFMTCKIHFFWDAPIMYPEKNVISYSENFLGTAPFYAIFRVLGYNTYNSYILWYLLIAILNYSACYLFLNKVTKNNLSATLGAFIFAFSIAIQSQLTHPQTFTRFPIPLVFLMLVNFLNTRKPIYFFLSYLFWVYQMYCSMYLGYLLFIPVLIFTIAIMVTQKEQFKTHITQKSWINLMITGMVANIILLLPLLIPYIKRASGWNIHNYFQIINTIPTPKSFFFSQKGSLLWNFLSFHSRNYPAWWDHQIFPGVTATLCMFIFIVYLIWFFYKKKENSLIDPKLYKPFLITVVLTFLIFIRIKNISGYFFIYLFPGFNGLRSLTRIINIELIFFAFSLSFVTTLLMNKFLKIKYLLFIIILALIITDNYFHAAQSYRTKKETALNRQDRIESQLKNLPKKSLVSYEPENIKDQALVYHVDMMLSTQDLGLRTINGCIGNCPAQFAPFLQNPNAKTRTNWFKSIKWYPDTLYVLNNDSTEPKMISKDEIMARKTVKMYMQEIKNNEIWLNKVKQKAIDKKISLDSMIYLDALWLKEQGN